MTSTDVSQGMLFKAVLKLSPAEKDAGATISERGTQECLTNSRTGFRASGFVCQFAGGGTGAFTIILYYRERENFWWCVGLAGLGVMLANQYEVA
jgi:hypothetical protein